MSVRNWRVGKDDNSVVNGDGEAVLWHNDKMDHPENDADLALAAAAPDLLAVLKELLNYEGGAFCVCDDEHVMDRAQAAIDKAEGRT